jgi:predicted phage-related endonuclease
MTINDVVTKVREYKELQAFIKQLEEEADAIKTALIAEMEAKNIDTMQADIFTIKYATYTNNRIDTAALKKDMPEIAAKFTKTTEARRFSVA